MKLTKPKGINEQIKEFKFEQVTPETVEEHKEEREELIAKVMEPAEKIAKEVTKETASPKSKTKKAKKLVKDRKELACLVKEARERNHKFIIARSLKEGYRYSLIEYWDEDIADPYLGSSGKVTIQEYKEFLENAIEVLDNYNPEDIVDFRPNTYKIDCPFIGTYGGYVEINHPVYREDMDENKTLSEGKEEISIEEKPIVDLPNIDAVEINPDIKINAAESIINNLIQSKFNEIESLKSAISTLQFEESNEDIINIINSLLDDANVHIGMLQKTIELIKPESNDSIEIGKEKAAELIDNNIKKEEE